MKIAIVTFWYNEQDLALFFLKHYSYIDKIFLYLDSDTNDNTKEICTKYPNVELRRFTFSKGFDDITKVEKINEVVKNLVGQFDWIYAVDSDEFIFAPKKYRNTAEFLRKQEDLGYNLVYAKIFQVYRHFTDKDLDINKPILPQRTHGDPNFKSLFNRSYIKPVIVKPEIGIIWNPGCHSFKINSKIKIAEEQFFGAHWAMVDERIAIKRRIFGRKMRLSARQIARGMTWQHINITEDEIKKRIKEHENDPDVLGSLI